MKPQLILFALLYSLLSGCSWLTPPKYDNNEYLIITELETHSRFLVNECQDTTLASKRIKTMVFRSETLQTYTFFLPNNSELHGSSNLINKQLLEFAARYQADTPPSSAYCKIKAKTLVSEMHRILTTLGQLQGVSE